MKEDITFPEVTGVLLAIARKPIEDLFNWHAYIINTNDHDLTNLLITFKGYDTAQSPRQYTSILRHSFEMLESNSFAVIESMDPSVFKFFNEFWVSYYYDEKLFDKKFIFAPGSIDENHLMNIDAIELEGVLHI